MQYLSDLFRYNATAARKVTKSLKTVDERRFLSERVCGIGSLRDLLVHIVGVEDYWINGVIRKQDFKRYKPEDFTGRDEIEKAWMKTMDDIRTLVGGLTPEMLGEQRTVKWDREYSFPVEKVLQHLYTHTVHHRGQAVAAIRLLGGEAPEVDII
jgi:uncharacterized damage-inducible protein DinB